MNRLAQKQNRLARRRYRVRKKISGTAARPRVSVFKSNRHLFVQAIDDHAGATLVSVSTLGGDSPLKATVAGAAELGKQLGGRLKEAGIATAVFDRNGRRYHGVIQSLADGIREAGIQM